MISLFADQRYYQFNFSPADGAVAVHINVRRDSSMSWRCRSTLFLGNKTGPRNQLVGPYLLSNKKRHCNKQKNAKQDTSDYTSVYGSSSSTQHKIKYAREYALKLLELTL